MLPKKKVVPPKQGMGDALKAMMMQKQMVKKAMPKMPAKGKKPC